MTASELLRMKLDNLDDAEHPKLPHGYAYVALARKAVGVAEGIDAELDEALKLLDYWKRLEDAPRWSDVEPEWDDKTGRRDVFLAKHREIKTDDDAG